MGLKFYFLGSGSRGNCTLIASDRWRLLIDVGFGLRDTNRLLAEAGFTVEAIDAALLTHTHTDHVKGPTLRRMSKSNVPLVCRPKHQYNLSFHDGYGCLVAKNLIRPYHDGRAELLEGLFVEPIALSHDSPETHGFLFEATLGGSTFRFAYVADCGWDENHATELAEKLQSIDLLALEFNHDERMERESGRPYYLIQRVLGREGHLSNHNAARLLEAARPRSLRALVQLHLSQECNTPALARKAAEPLLPSDRLHQTCQHKLGPVLEFD